MNIPLALLTLAYVLLVFRYEGWVGFYKGLTPNLLRVIPATAVTFVVYENVSSFLMKK